MSRKFYKQKENLFTRIPRKYITYEESTDCKTGAFSNSMLNNSFSYICESGDLVPLIGLNVIKLDNKAIKYLNEKKKNIAIYDSHENEKMQKDQENLMAKNFQRKKSNFSHYLFKKYILKNKFLKEEINIKREKSLPGKNISEFIMPIKSFPNNFKSNKTRHASFLRSFENKNRSYYYYKKNISNSSNYLSSTKLYYTINNQKKFHKNWKKPLKISLPHINLLPNIDISTKPKQENFKINKTDTHNKLQEKKSKLFKRNDKKILSIVKYEFDNINRF